MQFLVSASTPECEQKVLSTTRGSILPLEKKLKDVQRYRPQKILLIAGPTACGKTALSLLLSELLQGEIISADSMQVYRGMDIGTAKVSPQDQKRIPHHLIDIRHIQEPFNVVDFYYEARQCIESILARNKVPIVVGGSGFYFRTLIYGPPAGPPSISDVRAPIEEDLKRVGSESLFTKLKSLDPDYALTITQNDRHKIVRALEIITLTGKGVSQHEWKQNQPLSDFDYHCWFIYRPRQVLYPAIEDRCDRMIENGLLEEVKELEKQGIRTNPSAAQAIGYRQCLDFFQSSQDEEEYKKFIQKFKIASKHYAKRQFTWFKKEPLFHWLDVDAHDLEIAADIIAQEFISTL